MRLTGPAWLIGNLVVIVALFASPYTAGAVALFYGVTLLVAAWVGQPGCEAMVLWNLVFGRDDELGCPALAPVDALDSRPR